VTTRGLQAPDNVMVPCRR